MSFETKNCFFEIINKMVKLLETDKEQKRRHK